MIINTFIALCAVLTVRNNLFSNYYSFIRNFVRNGNKLYSLYLISFSQFIYFSRTFVSLDANEVGNCIPYVSVALRKRSRNEKEFLSLSLSLFLPRSYGNSTSARRILRRRAYRTYARARPTSGRAYSLISSRPSSSFLFFSLPFQDENLST